MAINREAEKALKLAEKVQMEQQAKILTKEKQDKIQEIQQILLTGLKFK